MEKINIAELLKDCPKGMELYSPIFGEVYLDKIRPHLAIVVTTNKERGDIKEEFFYDGRYGINGECMLFPSKDQQDWSKFQRPFKDGDVVTYKLRGSLIAFIYKERTSTMLVKSHFALYANNMGFCIDGDIALKEEEIVFATKEEKQKLFDAIKANGYEWNAEIKTLIRPVFSTFRKGDWVIDKQGLVHQIKNVVENVTNHTFGYDIVGGGYFNDNSDVRLWTIQDAKDGDVLVAHECLVLFKKLDGLNIKCYCTYHFMNNQSFYVDTLQNKDAFHPATEEEKEKLFQAIKDNGYKWNCETKTLEKLPKFKVGDKITDKNKFIYRITEITDKGYKLHDLKDTFITFEDADLLFVKVMDIFDINSLIPFESRVLVRSSFGDIWRPAIYGFTNSKKHYIIGGSYWMQCIPYEANKELLGTTNDCDDFYKTWE